jgi:hypothetical protein
MTNRSLSKIAAALLAAMAPASASAEVKWAPYLSAEVYAGSSKFDSENVSGPNGNVLFVPAMRFGENFSLLPSIGLGYRKSRDVQELAGGGFLTQEQQTRSLGLKGVRNVGDSWKAKAYASYRQELIIETKDESWGDGDFDYDKTAVGVEAERTGSAWRSLRFGLDYYALAFPNFSSLAAEARNLGITVNPGEDVLDFSAVDASVGADVQLGSKSLLSGYLLASSRDFKDQKIVKPDGTYTADDRSDTYLYLSAGYRHQLPQWSLFGLGVENLAGVDLSYAALDSDQHNYDAGRTKFNENYYDYSEIGFGPRVNLRFREKLTLGLSYMLSTRDYADRPVQNADGTYTTDTISSDVNTLRVTVSYPLLKNLSVEGRYANQNADSNMKFEQTYKYDYSSSNYFLGLSYQL